MFAIAGIKYGYTDPKDNKAKAAQKLADSGAAALITYRCGENAAEVINAADIKIYKAQDGSVADNIAKYKDGKLSLLTEIHPGFHNHGGGKQ